MIRNRPGGSSIGSENSVLEELDLVASQNAVQRVLMGLRVVVVGMRVGRKEVAVL